MENIQHLTLVEGTFAPSEAGKILSDLISRKINYHKLEQFSNKERFSKDISNSKKRIERLKITKNALKTIIEYAVNNQYQLQVNGFIEIKYLTDETEIVP